MSKALWRGCCRFEEFFFKSRRKLLEGKWDFMLCRVSSVLQVVTQNASSCIELSMRSIANTFCDQQTTRTPAQSQVVK